MAVGPSRTSVGSGGIGGLGIGGDSGAGEGVRSRSGIGGGEGQAEMLREIEAETIVLEVAMAEQGRLSPWGASTGMKNLR